MDTPESTVPLSLHADESSESERSVASDGDLNGRHWSIVIGNNVQ